MVKFLNGRLLADKIKKDLSKNITKSDRRPGLAAVLVGNDSASELYLELKEKACHEVGINFHKYLCNRDCLGEISQKELIDLIKFLNTDKETDGILLQLPLPEQYNTQKIIDAIDKSKDVDGFLSMGLKKEIVPPTVSAIIELLKSTGENLNDKKTLVIAKSDVYLKKIERYLKNFGIKKVKTENNIPKNSADYDIIIIALGQAKALKKEMVKDGVIVIDVGINKTDDKTVGDVDEGVFEKAKYVSPVPGGVGPLTVACLLRNVYELFLK